MGAFETMKIAVPIQAAVTHCCWCHFTEHVEVKLIKKRPFKKWWCSCFAEDLKEDERGPLRHEKCRKAEVEQ